MNKVSDARVVKRGLKLLYSYLPEILPPTGWYLADKKPSGAVMLEKDTWACMFTCFKHVAEGGKVCFSASRTGCPGASCYLGFISPSEDAGRFLAEKEKFKKNVSLGNAFYESICAPSAKTDFIVWESFADMAANLLPEVVNLWVNAAGLTDLVTLANYDRPDNDNVIIPFASGCQSIWTIPYSQKGRKEPERMVDWVVRCMDPAVRKYLPSDILSFSLPADRFVEIAENIPGSFLTQHRKKERPWKDGAR